MKKRRLWILASIVMLTAILAPRKVDSNTSGNSGHGRLRLRGYAIAVPFLPVVELGRWTAFYETGALGKEMTYLLGIPLEGREYFPDGVLKAESYFRTGRPYGDWRSFHPNGRLATVNVFDGKGAWPIAQKLFTDSGDLIFHVEGDKVFVDRTGEMQKKPNKAPEPTTTSVTAPAAQEPRQP